MRQLVVGYQPRNRRRISSAKTSSNLFVKSLSDFNREIPGMIAEKFVGELRWR